MPAYNLLKYNKHKGGPAPNKKSGNPFRNGGKQ